MWIDDKIKYYLLFFETYFNATSEYFVFHENEQRVISTVCFLDGYSYLPDRDPGGFIRTGGSIPSVVL